MHISNKNKLIISSLFTFAVLGIILFNSAPNQPKPWLTEQGIELSAAGFDQNEKARKAYENLIHRADSAVDWKLVNQENFRKLGERKGKQHQKSELVSVLDGKVEGRWRERGANNQSGDVRQIVLDQDNDSIYILATAGLLWKGHLNGSGWRVLNDYKVHSTEALGLVKKEGKNRIITSGIGQEKKYIFYSDDEGKTFQQSNGLDFYDTYGGIQIEVLENPEQTILALIGTWKQSPWGPAYQLYRSNDLGESFELVWEETNSSIGEVDMDKIAGDTRAFVFSSDAKTVWTVDANDFTVFETWTNNFGSIDATATYAGGIAGNPIFYILEERDVYLSFNNGANWTLKGNIGFSTYRAGIQADPLQPNKVIVGQVEIHESIDGGTVFTQYSGWYDFYTNPNMPHADLMRFEVLTQSNGELGCFALNHSGIHYAENKFGDYAYLNPEGLNISTYYDAVSFDEPNGFLFCGAQDKGYHGIADDGVSIQNHEFLTTGDYFEMAITGANISQQAIWREYPYGWFFYHFDPMSPNDGENFSIQGDDKQVWVVPTAPSADPNENGMWIGGGSLSGDRGSYLIKATLVGSNYNLQEHLYDFNEFSNSGSSPISAIGQSPVNLDRIYVMTGDGTFFVSNDKGLSFDKKTGFTGPAAEFLYGGEIEVSKLEEDLLFVGGSGYSNAPVYVSIDGGNTFSPFGNGLPPTFVHELELDPSENFLFAATDAGPYVCDISSGANWVSMLGDAPVQSYRSIQFMPNMQKIRFATYGRGIWDFDIVNLIGLQEANNEHPVSHVFPNPAAAGSRIQVDVQKNGIKEPYRILDLTGKVQAEGQTESNQIQLPLLSQGTYILQFPRTGTDLRIIIE